MIVYFLFYLLLKQIMYINSNLSVFSGTSTWRQASKKQTLIQRNHFLRRSSDQNQVMLGTAKCDSRTNTAPIHSVSQIINVLKNVYYILFLFFLAGTDHATFNFPRTTNPTCYKIEDMVAMARVRLKKKNGLAVPADAMVSVSNNILHSLFSSCKYYLNGQCINPNG